MRRHAKASSAGPTPRRAKGIGRIALLAAVAATFLLIPVAAAQAATLHVSIVGTGSGEVSSSGEFEGSPPIECFKPAQLEMVCDNTMTSFFGSDITGLTASPAADSVFAGWSIEEGIPIENCENSNPNSCLVLAEGSTAKVTVTFNLKPTGPTVTTNPGATEITQTSAKVSGTVNPKGKAVSECKVQYGLTESYGSEADCESLPGSGESAVPVEKTLSGLTPNKTYHFRFKATNADGSTTGSDQSFKTLPEAPAVVTTPGATEILQTMAKVAGSVNPNGASVSECKIEYGLTESYGSEANCEPSPGSGESPVAVSKTLTGLVANTTYHFRVKASNPGGTSNGSDQTFTTLALVVPTVTTEAATGETKTTANLNGSVNPNGDPTSCHFEYGLTTSYGSEASCASPPGSGYDPVSASAAISGLTANTTYHFRLVATNGAGAENGSDLTFTTKSTTPPTVLTTPGATQITSTGAKVAGSVNPNAVEVTVCKIQYGTTASYGSEADCEPLPGSGSSPVGVSKTLSGLVPNTTYHFRVTATNSDGTTNGSDQVFTTPFDPPSVITSPGATEIAQSTAKVAGSVNPNGANVSECKVEYGTTESYGSQANCESLPGSGNSPVAVAKALSGLAANTTYHFRFKATSSGGTSFGSDQSFKTLPNPPSIANTPGVIEITPESARVAGTVNPNGSSVSECKIQYGTTTAYGEEIDCEPIPGSGTSPESVGRELTGLDPNTTYHFRVKATNGGGTSNGPDQIFKTKPSAPSVVTIAGASEISKTSAKVGASVNPNSGKVTKCEVEYGTTTSYGSKKACASLPGSGSTPLSVSAALSGLDPNTTYHFRFIATNPGGMGIGADQSFKTQGDTCASDPSLCPAQESSGSSQAPAPVSAPSPAPAPQPKPLKCKRGFKKKTVGGKARCVKVRKHKGRRG